MGQSGSKSGKFVLKGLLLMVLLGFFILVVGIGLSWIMLPHVGDISGNSGRPTIIIKDRDGGNIATSGKLFGTYYKVADLPRHLIEAVLAVEDRRFYKHFGIDPKGIGRAFYVNLRAGRMLQGGSTLTQQLAKNLYFSPEQSLKRKFKEAIMAFKLERRFSKNEILALYLNRVYFGAGTYGVDAASRRYFGKSAAEVSLYEGAVLAGLLKAPSRYNPMHSPKNTQARAAIVINAMVAAGFLEPQQVSEIIQKGEANLQRSVAQASPSKAPYFANWIMSRLRHHVGTPTEDLVVYTSLDRQAQEKARDSLVRLLDQKGRDAMVEQAALVAMDGDGAVRAMVGGKSYRYSQFNRATRALRQPGSAFKLFVYLAALEQGYNALSILDDRLMSVAGWSPKNYSGKFYGKISLLQAFALSLNPATVALSEAIGRQHVKLMARRLGITTDLTNHASLALGASDVSLLELTTAYAIVANGGKAIRAHGILRVETARGKVLYQRLLSNYQILSPSLANRMRNLLSAVISGGTGKTANREGVLGGKTGTSSQNRDALFVGYTKELVTGVWAGNDDGSPMKGVTGGSLPVSIFLAAQDLQNAGKQSEIQLTGGRPDGTLPDEQVFTGGIY